MEKITPLNLDIELLNEYFSDICNGIIPQSLIDEVEYLYSENSYSIDRMNLINLIGNSAVSFEYEDINNCIILLEKVINGECECKDFSKRFPQQLMLVDNEDIHEILDDIIELCMRYLNKKIDSLHLIQQLIPYYNRIIAFFDKC